MEVFCRNPNCEQFARGFNIKPEDVDLEFNCVYCPVCRFSVHSIGGLAKKYKKLLEQKKSND